MVLEKMHRRFIRNGIGLDAQKQARLREINKQLSALEQKFGNNLLAETNAFQLIIDKEADLAGLPEAVRTAAAVAAVVSAATRMCQSRTAQADEPADTATAA